MTICSLIRRVRGKIRKVKRRNKECERTFKVPILEGSEILPTVVVIAIANTIIESGGGTELAPVTLFLSVPAVTNANVSIHAITIVEVTRARVHRGIASITLINQSMISG